MFPNDDGNNGQFLTSNGSGVMSWTSADTSALLPLSGGAMTGAITTNSTFDGVDIATRDAVLTSTTNTVNNLSNVFDPIGASVAMAIALGG